MDFFNLSTHAKGLISVTQIEEARLLKYSEASKMLPDGVAWLALDETELIKRFYQEKISGVCAFLKLPKFIQPVAHWLYMRYYLRQSVLKFDMKHVMLTCILVATKIENMHLTASEFTGKIPNCQPALIPEIELDLLQALDFDILFFHPHSALAGFALALNLDRSMCDDASRILEALVMTDALLMETPSHLALAACWKVAPDIVTVYVENTLKHAIECEDLVERLQKITDYTRPPTPFDTALLKDIDRRLYQARSALV